jgi:hypothetical protein
MVFFVKMYLALNYATVNNTSYLLFVMLYINIYIATVLVQGI